MEDYKVYWEEESKQVCFLTKMKIFSGTANQKLAEKVVEKLGTKLFLPEKFIFPDGEERIRILEKVVGEDVVVVQPISSLVNENLIELCFTVDALKRSGAKKVTAVIPYLGYQRQDRVFRSGEAVSLLVVIKMLEAVGIDKVLTFDLHSIKIPQFFGIPVSHLSALTIFAERIIQERLNKGAVLVSPDMGGIRRIKIISKMLDNMPFTSIEKERDLTVGNIHAKKIYAPSNHKSLKNRNAIIIDDVISGGGTIIKAVELLISEGVSKIFVFATHPVFSQNAPVLLQDAPIERVYVTNTVLVTKDKQFPKLEILSVAGMIAKELTPQL